MSPAPAAGQAPNPFGGLYNLPDPCGYFQALAPLGYRQPDIVAGFLAERGPAIREARGRHALRLLDFGCGYGAVGAVLGHRVLMEDIFAHYQGPWQGLAADQAFFRARRRAHRSWDIGGLDIADQAVAYAEACGFLQAGFTENLVETAPGAELLAFYEGCDLVIETGAVYDHVPACYQSLMAASAKRPWLLFGPRGDGNTAPLWACLEEVGYVIETVSSGYRRYRRYLDPGEQATAEARMRALGHAVGSYSQGDWYCNPLVLARPAAEAAAMPIERFFY
ncbi:MAG: hypothetical protein AAFY02_10535 [Pseudomonadota bacterium]